MKLTIEFDLDRLREMAEDGGIMSVETVVAGQLRNLAKEVLTGGVIDGAILVGTETVGRIDHVRVLSHHDPEAGTVSGDGLVFAAYRPPVELTDTERYALAEKLAALSPLDGRPPGAIVVAVVAGLNDLRERAAFRYGEEVGR
jgi:hypothetical protein